MNQKEKKRENFKKWREKNIEYSRQRVKYWAKENPEKVKASRQKSREKNRVKNRERQSEWRKEHPDYQYTWMSENKNYSKNWYLHTKYGLTLDAFNSMISGQGGKCASCGSSDWPVKGPVVDHDHETGEVRGILCHFCNAAAGLLSDSPEKLRKLADYLDRNKSDENDREA